ncbi:MAG: alpha-2-macroglobulin family protein [Pirellulales bacterium]
MNRTYKKNKRVRFITLLLLLSGFALFGTIAVPALRFAEEIQTKPTFESVHKLYNAGNYKEAYVQGRILFLDSDQPGKEIKDNLWIMTNSLRSLARIPETDAFLEEVVKTHPKKWRVKLGVANSYSSLQHYGQMIDNEYQRGVRRNQGGYINSVRRDRVRAMQLYTEAILLVKLESNPAEVANFYNDLSRFIVNNRTHGNAWRLQYLTETKELPSYDDGYNYYQQPQGTPVDEEGNPIYYHVPKTWQAAQNDGERFRFALEEAAKLSATYRNETHFRFAQFMEQQLGVQTMKQYGFVPRGSNSDDEDESGTFAIHTLKQYETIARLATGIKRFDIPDEFNHIKIYQKMISDPKAAWGVNAYQALAQVFENRRQYPIAAKHWKETIEHYGKGSNNSRETRLTNITGNWGTFKGGQVQAVGQGVDLQYVFRNGGEVEFTAHQIKVEQLLEDVKSYLKSNPRKVDYNQFNVQNIGHRIINQKQEKYLGKQVAKWSLELDPREKHFDRRITVNAPVQTAGAYMITAKMKNGNTSKAIAWVADTVIATKQLSGKKLYYVADAVTGKPIEGANVEFFGYRQERVKNKNEYNIYTKNFAESTDELGQIKLGQDRLPTNHQWLIMARTKSGRLAYLGFQGVWYGQHYDAEYNATKAFMMTDRPVYRPAQKLSYKFWVRHAKYDREDTSDFADKMLSVHLNDPQGNKIFDKQIKADKFGGIAGEWQIPEDAKLGTYRLTTDWGGGTFRIEEYKKPEFEVTIEAPTEPVMLGEKIEAKISAKYYFGSPVTEATVKYKITRTDHHQNWYPTAHWDWFYSPGYWWYCYDYPWYPNYYQWVGCRRPYPMWYSWSGPQPELISEREVKIGKDGTVAFEIDTELAKAIHGDKDHKYSITAEVRDKSRRTIVGTGQVLVARQPFKVFTWVNRGYYEVGQTVQANFQAQTLDNKPVSGKGELTLLKITYDKDRQAIETPVQTWKVDTGVEGTTRQQIKASAAGQYRLSYKLTDSKDHTIEGGYLFTVIGGGFDGSAYRFNHLELIPDKQEYKPGDTVKLQINTDRPGSTILLFLRPTNGVYLPPRVLKLPGKSTVYELDVIKKDMPNFFVEAMTIYDGQVHQETKEIVVPPEKRVINVDVIASNTEYKPGEDATVKVKLTDMTGEPYEGTTVLSIYDKSVEYISGGSNVPDIKTFFWKWRRHHQPAVQHSLTKYLPNIVPPGQRTLQYLGVFGHSVADDLDAVSDHRSREERSKASGADRLQSTRSGAFGSMAPAMQMMQAQSDEMADAQGLSAGFAKQAKKQLGYAGKPGGGQAAAKPDLVKPTVRSNFADTALWAGSLMTNKKGIAEVSLKMPENLTAWKIKVWALGHGTKVGSGESEVVTRKNLILRMQAPRFFVQKDEVVLSANVHNYLKTEKEVQVSLDLPGKFLKIMGDKTKTVSIKPNGETRVDWRVKVMAEGTATVRMKALSDEESDAMETTYPVYVHGMLKTESWAGTVQPDVNSSIVNITVPKQRRPEQSQLTVRYTPTLAGAMVDALPYMVDYPYGCTEQTLNRFLPTVITQKVLMEMNLDLKEIQKNRTNLNAQELGDPADRKAQWNRFDRNPVFNQTEVTKMVKTGVTRLTDMQVSDGGWGWFSGYGERSYPHTTAVVVRGLQTAQNNDVALVPGMLDRGVQWLVNYQNGQVKRLQNAKPQIKPWKQYADNTDALIYMTLVNSGKQNKAMREFLYRDRTKLSVYAKGMFGLALHKVKDVEKLAMVLRNIEQYLVTDLENETAYLKMPEDNYWWYWYGDPIEAHAYYLKLLAASDPTSKTAPRLVKYLLNNRKHATYWKSTRDTSLCIEAFADYLRASKELSPEMTVEIWVDGKKKSETEFTRKNLFSVNNTFTLTGEEVTDGDHKIEIRRKGKGAVYHSTYLTNFTLEDFITKAGLEVKVERRFYKLVAVQETVKAVGSRGQAVDQKVAKFRRELLKNEAEITSGDLIEVELVIESKNDYEYLLFEDKKAAGFEAVDLRSGYNGNSLGAYMELHDESVSFFVRRLPRGKHSLTYKLKAEIPGKFSALPAVAQAMYAPELVGNSDEMKVLIHDLED